MSKFKIARGLNREIELTCIEDEINLIWQRLSKLSDKVKDLDDYAHPKIDLFGSPAPILICTCDADYTGLPHARDCQAVAK